MKKTNVFGAIFIMAIILFTSCLGDGGTSHKDATVGVVRYDYKSAKYLLDTYMWGTFYSPSLNSKPEELREGACYFFNFELDMDLPENSNSNVSTTGYYTITLINKAELSRYSMSPVFLDTATLLTNEIPIINPYLAFVGYVKGIVFLQHHIKQPEGQGHNWNLSCDTQNMVVEENGTRYYDVFVRATIDGSAGTKTPTETAPLNAYDMKYFLESAANVEKNQKDKMVNIRFNYISEITEGKMVWKKSEKLPLSAEGILAENK